MFSQNRGIDIPLKVRGRDRVPRVSVWRSQLGVLDARIMALTVQDLWDETSSGLPQGNMSLFSL